MRMALLWCWGLLLVCAARASVVKRSEGPGGRHLITVDLSALRPTMPGLLLYGEGGNLPPKLVQIDLASLNPQLKPHVVWPQYQQMELLDERPFELDSSETFHYLTDMDDPLSQRMAKMSDWLDDPYDFLDDMPQAAALKGSLPLADEVIVPLDWEEGRKGKKRSILVPSSRMTNVALGPSSYSLPTKKQGTGQQKVANDPPVRIAGHEAWSVPWFLPRKLFFSTRRQ